MLALGLKRKGLRWRAADVQKRSTTCQINWTCSFVRHFQHNRQLFSSCLFSYFPLSLLSQLLFHERHNKHTGYIKRNTMEMLMVFFVRVENCSDAWERSTSKAGLVVPSALCEVALASWSDISSIHSVSKSHFSVLT